MPTATLRLAPDTDAMLRARVPLAASRTEAGLAAGLAELVRVTRDLPAVIAAADEPPGFLRVTFHTPERRWLSERRFFERTARHPSLRELTLAYVAQTNPSRWPADPFRGAGLWTSIMAPAGSLAIVPLALRDLRALPALGEHLRGADVDHETFHRALITELVARHGLAPEVLDLLAVRAVDAAGQHGPEDLCWLAATTPFGELVRAPGGPRAFAARVDVLSRRRSYRGLYVANAGRALFPGDAARQAEWFGYFRDQGLAFEPRDLDDGAPRTPYAPRPFADDWEEAAGSDDVD